MVSSLAANLRRLMAREGLTQSQLAARAGLNVQTLKQMLTGRHLRPHARSLHKLAAGLGVEADELFRTSESAESACSDRASNPVVDDVLADYPHLCASWTEQDFGELYSHFGTGGGFTYEGALAAVHRINRARSIQEKTAVLLQSEYGDLLSSVVELLFKKIEVAPQKPSVNGSDLADRTAS